MKSFFSFLVIPIVFLLLNHKTEVSGKVIRIKDGDTIEILYQGKPFAVRLAHIDCPEKKQPFGNVAKEFTSSLCYNQSVTITGTGYDRNKRMIGVVVNEKGETVNKELVKAGLAWHYKKYSRDSVYANLEMQARKLQKGLWKEPNAIAPWQWRPARTSSR